MTKVSRAGPTAVLASVVKRDRQPFVRGLGFLFNPILVIFFLLFSLSPPIFILKTPGVHVRARMAKRWAGVAKVLPLISVMRPASFTSDSEKTPRQILSPFPPNDTQLSSEGNLFSIWGCFPSLRK